MTTAPSASSYTILATRHTLTTPYGNLAVYTSTPAPAPPFRRPALLLIHGNSSSSLVFRHFFSTPSLTSYHHLIAFDLPGHGQSSNADADSVPSALPVEETYTMPGYARVALHVLDRLNVEEVVVFGWSLGGHIGIEMMALLPPSRLRGLMITGTPAVPRGRTHLGFCPQEHMAAAGRSKLTVEEVGEFARGTAGAPYESWMRADVERCDGRAREIMFGAFRAGRGVDQKEMMERNREVKVAVVNGKEEPFVDVEFVREGVEYGGLWEGRCFEIERAGHAPFWDRGREEFLGILERFLDSF